ncbi:ribonuclease P/MRP protein subunit RPP1 [Halorubrum trapanicum]|uniref:Ribonuclease P protein component 3 n=1 Tax=Halorubrum trapanicum TaxID=29284 RepID=A0A8J7R5M3_9EURY|nr:RNase P subunit p30 family protein [Halorubrum trapanicum]MBP1900554.1 ribonuclease P/MRP protein subunit RPP1 [Halorubrum trapanicum]
MYEAVHAHPDGETTVARHAATAARHGYDGIVVRTRDALEPTGGGESVAADGDGGGGSAATDRDGSPVTDPDALREEYGIDAVDAVEIDADDPTSASGAVGNYRSDRTVVCVVGGDDAVNRFAVEQSRVDVLVRPMADGGDFNHVLAKAARDNGVRVEFDFGPALRATGGKRVRALADLRKLREIVDHYDAPYVVSANARSHLQLRAPRELIAVGEAIGFDAETVREGLRAWGDLVERNRERRSEGFIEPGVRRGRYEEDGC